MIFSNAKQKMARETARGLISGQATLLALWTLLHAGVIEAMRKSSDGLEPQSFAASTSMEAHVLVPLLDYLVDRGLMVEKKGRYALSSTGAALIEYESGSLKFVYAYQPVMQMLEHLLARLKVYGSGVNRKASVLTESAALRHAAEVYPAIEAAVKRCKGTHIIDLHCGTGALLAQVAAKMPALVGVGLESDGTTVRAANELFAAEKIDKRFLAVPASGADAMTDTRRTFERTGISQQLWDKLDVVVACGMFGDLALLSMGEERVVAMLASAARALPKATFIFAEPCTGAAGEQNYCAPEMLLLLRLSRTEPLAAERWADIFEKAGMNVKARERLGTEGICVWTCVAAK